jgi:predicted ATPase/DNA-binding CsgD family transcriptional regulator
MSLPSDGPAGVLAFRAAPRPRSTLPAQPTPLLGRDGEIAGVATRLRDPAVRLLTLTGPGGIGKTRLAVAVADRLRDAFADGAVFVDLAPLRDPALVAATIARTLDLREVSGEPALHRVTRYLAHRHLLLVLDNCEHLPDAMPLLVELLAACPALKVLATSRALLHLRWEHAFPVPPLPCEAEPTESHRPADLSKPPPAVALFVRAARAVAPAFALTAENSPVIVEICRRLDGLPLAIELAAARSRVLPPQALLAHLTNRLRLLAGGQRDLPARQQTLRDAIGWSFERLTPAEQALFSRLAVFVGGCSLAAAEAVCGQLDAAHHDLLALVSSLVDKNLLRQQATPAGEARFDMLETIRDFALDQLAARDDVERVQRQHAEFFLQLAEEAEPHLRGPQRNRWLERLEQESLNLRAALAWSLADADSAELGLRLATALYLFWTDREYLSEGRHWLAQALQRSTTGTPSLGRAVALCAAGRLAFRQGDTSGRGLIDAGIALLQQLGERRQLARALVHPGAPIWVDYTPASWAACQEALALARDSGDSVGEADALHFLGHHAEQEDDAQTAWSHFEASARLYRTLGDHWGLVRPLLDLGRLATRQSACADARALLAECLAAAAESREVWFQCLALWTLGHTAVRDHAPAEAVTRFLEVLAVSESLGQTPFRIAVLEGLAAVCTLAGHHVEAARFVGAAEAAQSATTEARVIAGRALFLRDVLAAIRRHLDADAFAAAWAEGGLLSLERSIAAATALVTAPGVPPQAAAPVAAAGQRGGLTLRETEILQLLATGLTNQEIAQQLVLSPRTVENHAYRIYSKLGARGRAEAIAYAFRHGLLSGATFLD